MRSTTEPLSWATMKLKTNSRCVQYIQTVHYRSYYSGNLRHKPRYVDHTVHPPTNMRATAERMPFVHHWMTDRHSARQNEIMEKWKIMTLWQKSRSCVSVFFTNPHWTRPGRFARRPYAQLDETHQIERSVFQWPIKTRHRPYSLDTLIRMPFVHHWTTKKPSKSYLRTAWWSATNWENRFPMSHWKTPLVTEMR